MSNVGLKSAVEAGGVIHLIKEHPEAERTIEAAWIEHAANSGTNIEIWNATIHGQLNLSGKELRGWLALRHCVVQDAVDFSGCIFHSDLILASTTFLGTVDLRNASAEQDVNLNRTTFKVPGNSFINIEVKGYLMAIGARFLGATSFDDATFGPDVRFNRSVFARLSFNSVQGKGSIHFERVRFQQQADFIGMDVDGDLDFTDTFFASGKDARFEVLKVGGDATFDRANFGQKVFFDGSQIDGQGSFRGVVFANGASFTDVKVGGDLIFRHDSTNGFPAAFQLQSTGDPPDSELAADFSDARVSGNFDFRNAEVEGKSSFVGLAVGGGGIFRSTRFNGESKIRFDLAHFGGGAFFQDAQFNGEVDFRGVQIDLDARFSGADFRRAATFEASKFTGLATFASGSFEQMEYGGTTFDRLSLKHARFEQDAHFDDAVIRGNADFRDATFQVVYFSKTGTAQAGGVTVRQFQHDIDLRGCTYKAIDGDWRSLLPREQSGVEYNRQPYTQLGRFLTNIGQPEVADEVYLERRTAERKSKWRKRRYMAWFGDFFYFIFLHYGVRPWQLLVLAIILLVAGTLFFSQPHAASAKEKKEVAPNELPARDAFELSFHQFLPVDIPFGDQWIPSREGIDSKPGILIRPSTFATFFLRLPGWILVPLGIASFTRLLRGAGSTKGGGGD